MKKTLKVLLAVVITPIALFLILTLLLYCPPVQKWAVEKAAQVASEKTGMRITVEQLRLSFPLDLRLQGLKALQPNDSLPGKTDTIADVRSLLTMGRCSHHCYIVTCYMLHVTLRISHPPHAVRPPREAVGHPPRQLPYSASTE